MDRFLNIIWVEDNPEKMDSFKDLAESEQIILKNYKNSIDAIKVLESNVELWDGIILDAMGFYENEHEAVTLKGMAYALSRVENLKKTSVDDIPVFIFTGQPHLLDNDSFEQMISAFHGVDVYYKSKDDNRLIDDILNKCASTLNRTIRSKYSEELNLFSDSCFFPTIKLEENKKRLFDILYNLEFRKEKPIKNNIRTFLEVLLPEFIQLFDIITNGESLNTYKKILTRYELANVNKLLDNTPIISQAMQNTIRLLVESTQEGSHNIQIIVGNYSAEQLKYSLLEFLSWYRNYKAFIEKNMSFKANARQVLLKILMDLGVTASLNAVKDVQYTSGVTLMDILIRGIVVKLLPSMIVIKLEDNTNISISQSSKGYKIGDNVELKKEIIKGSIVYKLS